MRIFNQSKVIELTKEQCDFTKGHLKDDIIKSGENIERICVYIPYTQKQLYKNEIASIEIWFETKYREMIEKCSRRIHLGILMKDGKNPHDVLMDYYAQAEMYANRINELELLIEKL